MTPVKPPSPLSADELAFVQAVATEELHLKRPVEQLRHLAGQCSLPPPPAEILAAGLTLLAELEHHWRSQAPASPFGRRLAVLARDLRTFSAQWLELQTKASLLQLQLQDLATELLPALYQDLPLVQERVAALTRRLQPLPAAVSLAAVPEPESEVNQPHFSQSDKNNLT